MINIGEVSDGLVRFGYAEAKFCSKEEAHVLYELAKKRNDYKPGCTIRRSVALQDAEKRVSSQRGDDVAWIHSNKEKNALGLVTQKLRRIGLALGPALAAKVQSGVRSPKAIHSVIERCIARRGSRTLLADSGRSASPPAMLARYSQGRPGFRPHVDAVILNDTQRPCFGARPDPRVLTLVLYLNDVPKAHGGAIRIWRPGFEALARDHPELATIDLPPRAGTLLFFWSAAVIHQVKPVLQGDRYALSMWFHEPEPVPIVTPLGEDSGEENNSLLADEDISLHDDLDSQLTDDTLSRSNGNNDDFCDFPPPPPADITPENLLSAKKLKPSTSVPSVSVPAPARVSTNCLLLQSQEEKSKNNTLLSHATFESE